MEQTDTGADNQSDESSTKKDPESEENGIVNEEEEIEENAVALIPSEDETREKTEDFQNSVDDGDEVFESENRHEVLKRSLAQKCEYVSDYNYGDSFGQGCENRMLARVTEDGNWLIRWNVENQKEDDFIALCYQG